METILRERCTVTGSADMEPLYQIKRFPVFMGCVDHAEEADLYADMDWEISRSSGMIQLRHLLPLDVLYPAAHGAGAVGGVWQQHHRSLARFISQFAPSSVLEVGGGNGVLAREYQQLATASWTIVEPNPTPVEGCKAEFIRSFFDDKFVPTRPADAVVHSHLFEHLYEPDQFMRHLSGFLQQGQHLLFSVPNLKMWLERCYTSSMSFEHTYYLTEPYVEYLLAKHGFALVKKEYYLPDHSIFYAAVRSDAVTPAVLPASMYEDNKHAYPKYVAYHEDLIAQINAQLQASSDKVYLFGAHIFAQALFGFGLDPSRIICLLDNDKNKQGRRLYGTQLMVHSPAILAGLDAPRVILKAGQYNAEIKENILGTINASVQFIE
jgi:hypothetical protein